LPITGVDGIKEGVTAADAATAIGPHATMLIQA
jgi:hypothetical protein